MRRHGVSLLVEREGLLELTGLPVDVTSGDELVTELELGPVQVAIRLGSKRMGGSKRERTDRGEKCDKERAEAMRAEALQRLDRESRGKKKHRFHESNTRGVMRSKHGNRWTREPT
tara:strand:+ start:52 stop:399 length:348 start_codon:yes stop_codon:yes gene_type:complete